VELYLPSPNTYSWHGAYLSTGTNLPFTFTSPLWVCFMFFVQRADNKRDVRTGFHEIRSVA
jgi:hypothetical protein